MLDVHPRDLRVEQLDVRIGLRLDMLGIIRQGNILLAGNPDSRHGESPAETSGGHLKYLSGSASGLLATDLGMTCIAATKI